MIERQIDDDVFTERLVSVAYTVSRRTPEIGLRTPPGAARREVLRMVMSEVGLPALLGVVLAVPTAFGLNRLIQTQPTT